MEKFKNNIINLNRYTALNFSTKTFQDFGILFFITRNQVRFKAIENNILVKDNTYKLIISQKSYEPGSILNL